MRVHQADMDSTSFGSYRATLTLNGKVIHIGSEVPYDTSLNSYIRDFRKLPGTKFMCYEGGCGSCVVTVTSTHPVTKKEQSYAVNSCLMRVFACHGSVVTTIEGIKEGKSYNKVSNRLATYNGTQCGYCSPGMVMNMYSLLKANQDNVTQEMVENAFAGNICRCTGYRPILDAFKSFATDASDELKLKHVDIEEVGRECAGRGSRCSSCCEDGAASESSFLEVAMAPPQLQLETQNGLAWFRVTSVDQIFQVFDRIGDKKYMLLGGDTAQGVKPDLTSNVQVYIDVNHVAELRKQTITDEKVVIGANVNITEFMTILESAAKNNPSSFNYLLRIIEHIQLVANVPVRNIGTIAGNLFLKYIQNRFQSDIFLLLETVGAELTIRSPSGTSKRMSPSKFLLFDMKKCVITEVTFHCLRDSDYFFRSYKIMPRAQNAPASVNAAFLFKMDKKKTTIISKPNIVYGGITKKFIHASKTEEFLANKTILDENVLKAAISILEGEVNPDVNPPELSPKYRRLLAVALLYKTVLDIQPSKIKSCYRTGSTILQRPLSSGTQVLSDGGLKIPKLEAFIQCAGEAEYVNDMPDLPGLLHGALVLCNKGIGKFSLDKAKIKKMKGLVGYFDTADIHAVGGENSLGTSVLINTEPEELFCSGNVLYAGQPVGVVVAESRTVALKLADKIADSITLTKAARAPLVTITDVLQSSLKSQKVVITNGRIIPKKTGEGDHKISGNFETGSQYHYSMELQVCYVVPKENGQLDVFPSTQWLHNTQRSISTVLNKHENKISVKVRRVGGAYGCKITRSSFVACACALAAELTQRPVKMILSMVTNTSAIGKRSSQYAEYAVSFNDDGQITSLNADIYQDLGCSLNDPVWAVSIASIQSIYNIDSWNVNIYAVKTDTPSTSWCRAPGSIEVISLIENIIEKIAFQLKMDPMDVRIENQSTNDKARDIFLNFSDKLTQMHNEYKKKKAAADNFNKANRWKKKGVSMIPLSFPIDFFLGYYCMVSVFPEDGTVSIIHGSSEIGQGINTKVATVAQHVFGIDISMIQVKPSDVDVCPNNGLTGTSLASDAASYACLKSCEKIMSDLNALKKKLKLPDDIPWPDLILNAYLNNVNLNSNYMWSSTEEDSDLQSYKVFAACITEVEVDVLTGQHLINQVYIFEDVGRSLSPLVDLGQMEGAFVMALGQITSEEIQYSRETGALLTNRTWTYDPPGAKDIPVKFDIEFAKSDNPVGVLGTKATGEPPSCLAVSILFALRQALYSARQQAGKRGWFDLDAPCTIQDKLLMAATDPTQFKLTS